MKATKLIAKLANAVAENGDFDIEDLTKESYDVGIYVDLGLPSGTLWAKGNYGHPNDYYTFDEAQKLSTNLPTKEQLEELIKYTTSKWIENYYGSGVNGRLFTSKKNGKSMFIPASGYTINSSVYGRGIGGFVWSSSLNSSYPNTAWYLFFNSSIIGVTNVGSRCLGQSVRAVTNI